jgi:hypothetical protein
MDTSNESFNLLHLIANDCYKMGHFYYACKVQQLGERLCETCRNPLKGTDPRHSVRLSMSIIGGKGSMLVHASSKNWSLKEPHSEGKSLEQFVSGLFDRFLF